MTASMTGFARISRRHTMGDLVWELRSVNHRYLEITLRLPDDLRSLEPEARKRIAARLQRGKVDATLRLAPANPASRGLALDEALLTELARVARHVDEKVNNPLNHRPTIDPLQVLRWPGVIVEPQQPLESARSAALEVLDEALTELVEGRRDEGARLTASMRERSAGISQQIAQLEQRRPAALERARERLTTRLREIEAPLDSGRLEQELVYLAQKLDIDEELQRLASHVTDLQATLDSEGAKGRRLDFLMQELNREVNTIGSKALDAEMSRLVVDLKVLVEQLREQAQNLE
jgi:uncharacterized protein (TIGR00255 family)